MELFSYIHFIFLYFTHSCRVYTTMAWAFLLLLYYICSYFLFYQNLYSIDSLSQFQIQDIQVIQPKLD
jgi:hypothetical protein